MPADPRQISKTFSVMGQSFIPGASVLIEKLTNRPGTMMELKREPKNPKDPNAIGLWWGNYKLGWVPRGLAAELAPFMDSGVKIICRKAAGVAGFKGAVRGVFELAYIPPEPKEVPNDELHESSAGAAGES